MLPYPTAIALVAATLFGFAVTRFYDRKGLHRHPHPVGDVEQVAPAHAAAG
jgi:hypothetical protein